MLRRHREFVLFAAVLVVALPWGTAGAAGVELQLSASEVYVDVPFRISIVITDAGEYEPPRIPDIAGLRRLENRPGTSTRTLTVNGRTTRSVTLTYEFIALDAGFIAIPPITVVVDGQALRTAPARIIASEIPQGPAQGKLLFLELKSDREVYYLGETIDMTLEIWLRPYFDDRFTVRFDAQAMFDRISVRASQWGVFREGLQSISMEEIVRRDADNVQRAYFVYYIKQTISPHQAGSISFDDVRVLVNYPTKIRRARSLFSTRWQTVEARPVAATVDHPPIVIESPPREGRPASFAGAVGLFGFEVIARPRDVAVGDPITLTLSIEDRSLPSTNLAVLRPPDLARNTELARDFRVAGDPAAGVVAGRRKTFTQTIRARNDEVSVIPALTFSYFDPRQREYVSVSSEPIPVRVRPTAAVTNGQIIGAGAGRGLVATELHEVVGGIQANYTGTNLLLSSQAFAFTWPLAVPVALGPFVFITVAAGRYRARRRTQDRGYVRRRRARRVALRLLGEAADAGADRQAILAASTVCGYVADRFNLPAGALTTAEVVRRLAERHTAPDLLRDVQRLLADCEQHRYAGAVNSDSDSIAQRARLCIDRLEREKLQ